MNSTICIPEFVKMLAILLWAGFYLLIVASVSIQFAYRYLCLLGSDSTKNLNWFQEMLWVVHPIFPAVFYTWVVYFLCQPDEFSDDYVREFIFENYSLVLSKLPRFIMVPYYPNGAIRWNNFSFLFCAGFMVFSHYSVILYCGVRMHFDMKMELKKFSAPNRQLQRQFFKALIFQSFGPTIFIFMPAVPVLISPLIPPSFGIQIDWQTGWLYSMIGVYPPFDSIAFMMIVSEYKDVISSRYFFGTRSNSEESVMSVSERFQQNRLGNTV